MGPTIDARITKDKWAALADDVGATDTGAMRGRMTFDALSRRSPTIVAISLCAALGFYWTEVPEALPYALAIALCALALVLMATRDRRRPFIPKEETDDEAPKGWIAQELAGQGTPAGSYVLAFFALVTIWLTGIQGTYALPAWAALALTVAWSIANLRRQADQ